MVFGPGANIVFYAQAETPRYFNTTLLVVSVGKKSLR